MAGINDRLRKVHQLPAVVLVFSQHLKALSESIACRAIRMPFACSIGARRPKAPWRLWYSRETLQRDVDHALELGSIAVHDIGEDPALCRFPDVDRVGFACSNAMTGQAASRTISVISSRACSN